MSAHLATLEQLGAGQWSLVTAGQAVEAGISRTAIRRLHDTGTLTQIQRGVYVLPSSQHGRLQELRAAWLSINPRRFAWEREGDGRTAGVRHRRGSDCR